MSITVSASLRGGVFAVPNQVVDQHLKFCSPLQLQVLLLALRHSDQPVDPDQLAAFLRKDKGDIADAIQYWVQAGLFLPEEPLPAAPSQPAAAPVRAVQAQPAPPQPSVQQHQAPTGQKVTTLRQRPRLDTREINRLAETDKTIPSLLQVAQEILGRELIPAESETLVYLYRYCCLSSEYICLLLHYCASIGKGNLRYVEKTAAGWMDKGIDTAEKAAAHIDHLANQAKAHRLVQDVFGIHGRDLTTKEKAFAEKWVGEFAMGPELIRLAYERTVDATGHLSFSYTNKILSDWHRKGIRTPAQALEEMERGSAARREEAQESTPSYDLDKIKWMMTNGPMGNQ